MSTWESYYAECFVSGDGHDYAAQQVQVETIGLMLKLSGPLEDRTVLDAGCGTGRSAMASAVLGADVSAFDIVEEQVARNRARFGLSVQWSVGDLADPSTWPEGEFDVVQAIESAHCVQPARLLAALWRRVKPGGRLLFTLPNADSPISRFSPDKPPITHMITAKYVGSLARSLEGCGPWTMYGLHYGIDQSIEAYDPALRLEWVDPPPARILACFRRGTA